MIAPPGEDGFEELSPTAAVAWRLLDRPRSVESLAHDLAAAYSAEPDVVAGDVQALLDVLVERRLVVRA